MSTKTENGPDIVTSIDRPQNLLPSDPTIELESEANTALLELSYMEAHTASAAHACDAKIRELREQHEAELGIRTDDGEFVSYADRAATLKAALRQYVVSQRPELKTANGTKSAELRQGVLSWVKSRDSVKYAAKVTHAKAIEAIDESTAAIRANGGGLKQRLSELASSVRLFARDRKARTLELFVDLQAKISLTRVAAAIKDKKLTADQVKPWGLVFKKGQDEFVVKPHQYEVPRR